METMARSTILGSCERRERNRKLATLVISPERRTSACGSSRRSTGPVEAGYEAASAALAAGGTDALRAALSSAPTRADVDPRGCAHEGESRAERDRADRRRPPVVPRVGAARARGGWIRRSRHGHRRGVGVVEALRLRPDIVLLDVGLPDITGFEVASRLRDAASPAAIVLASSRERSDFGTLVADSGARGLIDKSLLSGEAVRALVT